MNNKGVTLIELLIVIVVMGIISAFAIPAVGSIIENTQLDAVYADAIAVENAAKLYCAQTTCADDEALAWSALSSYVNSFDTSGYNETDGTNTNNIAVLTSGDWVVTLTGASGEYTWPGLVPSDPANDREDVTTTP